MLHSGKDPQISCVNAREWRIIVFFIILEMILYNVLYFQTKAIGLMKASLYSSYRKNSTSESIYKFSISTIF